MLAYCFTVSQDGESTLIRIITSLIPTDIVVKLVEKFIELGGDLVITDNVRNNHVRSFKTFTYPCVVYF